MTTNLQLRCVSAVILALLMAAAPAAGQEDPPLLVGDLKVRAAYGGCFGAAEATENCDVFEAAIQFPLARLLHRDHVRAYAGRFGSGLAAAPAPYRRRRSSHDKGAEGEVSYSTFSNDMHRPPPSRGGGVALAKRLAPADEHDNTAAVEHGGTDVVVFHLLFPLPVRDDFLFEPFAGAGLSWIRETDDPEPRIVLEARNAVPTLDYGLRASLPVPVVGDWLLVQAQYRRVVVFAKDLTYIFRSGGEEFGRERVKVAPSAVGAVTFGLAVGLP